MFHLSIAYLTLYALLLLDIKNKKDENQSVQLQQNQSPFTFFLMEN